MDQGAVRELFALQAKVVAPESQRAKAKSWCLVYWVADKQVSIETLTSVGVEFRTEGQVSDIRFKDGKRYLGKVLRISENKKDLLEEQAKVVQSFEDHSASSSSSLALQPDVDLVSQVAKKQKLPRVTKEQPKSAKNTNSKSDSRAAKLQEVTDKAKVQQALCKEMLACQPTRGQFVASNDMDSDVSMLDLTNDKAPAQEKAPAQDKAPAQEKAPAQDKAPAQEKAPAQGKAPAQEKASAEDKAHASELEIQVLKRKVEELEQQLLHKDEEIRQLRETAPASPAPSPFSVAITPKKVRMMQELTSLIQRNQGPSGRHTSGRSTLGSPILSEGVTLPSPVLSEGPSRSSPVLLEGRTHDPGQGQDSLTELTPLYPGGINIISDAKKREAFTKGQNKELLLFALLTAVFGEEQLAMGKACGLRVAHNNSGEFTTIPLQADKLAAIKECVLRRFKQPNGQPCFTPREFNDKVNQKCATARRALKKKLSKQNPGV